VLVFLYHRQRDIEPAALAFASRFRPDAPFVVLGDLAAQREALKAACCKK